MTECQACGRPTQLFLCQHCVGELGAMLAKLPEWLDNLAEAAVGHVRLGGGGGRRPHGDRGYAMHGDDSALANCACGHRWHPDLDPMPAHAVEAGFIGPLFPGEVRYEPSGGCTECTCVIYDGKPNHAVLQRRLLATGRVNANASNRLDYVHNTLTTIVRDLCEHRGIELAWRRQPTSADLSHWLGTRVDVIAVDEAAGAWFADIERHTKAIEHIIDRPAPPRFVGPCIAPHVCTPRCPTPCPRRDQWCDIALTAPLEAIETTCPDCRATHNITRLQAVAKKRAEALRFTAEQLREILECEEPDFPRQTLHSWIKRGQLTPSGYQRSNGRIGGNRHSDDDEPVYRLADARKLRSLNARKVRAG